MSHSLPLLLTLLALLTPAHLHASNDPPAPPANDEPETTTTEEAEDTEEIDLADLIRSAEKALEEGDWEKAVALHALWIEHDPFNPMPRFQLATSLFRAGQTDESARQLERALLADPTHAAGWALLGRIHDQLENPYLALSAITRAVHLAPDNPAHRTTLAAILDRRGWRDAAETELRTAIEIAPDHAPAHFNLAVLYLNRTPPARSLARRHYQLALRHGAAPDETLAKALEGESDAP